MSNMLATAFAEAGGGSFSQPLMSDDLGGMTLAGNPLPGFGNRLYLSFATGSASPIPVSGAGSTEVTNVLSGPFNNMGIPGALSYHLMAPGYGNVANLATGTANPYFVRFASEPNTTVIADALAQSPSFFTLWIGNNDVLGYAITGGTGEDRTGNPDVTQYNRNDITDPQAFAAVYSGLLQGLTAQGAKGAVANIPDATLVPYFNTVPYAPLDPTNASFAAQIPLLNATYAQLNGVFAFLGVPERSIQFSETAASAVVIKDESLPDLTPMITQTLIEAGADPGQAAVFGMLYGQARQATPTDLIVLTARNVIGELNTEAFAMLQNLGMDAATAGQLSVNGITFPMEDQWVLTPTEQNFVRTATTAFNQTIKTLADQYGLAFVDANAYMATVANTGIMLSDGSTVTATYATGGGFSLDGIHPSPRGYALLANLFINAIETSYGAELPRVDPLAYTGLYIK